MAKIRFTSEYVLANALRPKTYKKGAELDVNEDTARRYIRRGVALRVDDPPADPSLFGGDAVEASGEAESGDKAGEQAKAKVGAKKRQRIE